RRVKYRGFYSSKPIIVGNINNKENRIEPAKYPVILEVDSLFNFHLFHDPDRGSFRFVSNRFHLNAPPITLSPSELRGEQVPAETTGHFSVLHFQRARFRGGDVVLGSVAGELVAHLDYDTCEAAIVGFSIKGTKPARDDAVLSLSGQGALVC